MLNMAKLDPIIAVKDVAASATWYQSVFGCRRTHGGDEFATLVNDDDEVLICLHQWGAHEHPTMLSPDITPGNGLIFYFRTHEMKQIRANLEKIGGAAEEDIHLNPNSNKMEFSFKDLDGYFWIVTEFHTYDG